MRTVLQKTFFKKNFNYSISNYFVDFIELMHKCMLGYDHYKQRNS